MIVWGPRDDYLRRIRNEAGFFLKRNLRREGLMFGFGELIVRLTTRGGFSWITGCRACCYIRSSRNRTKPDKLCCERKTSEQRMASLVERDYSFRILWPSYYSGRPQLLGLKKQGLVRDADHCHAERSQDASDYHDCAFQVRSSG